MFILGLLLILGSAALGAAFVLDGTEDAHVELFGTTFTTSAAELFFIGAVTMLLFLLGLWLLTSSMGRSRRKRGERKATRRQQKESVAQLEADRAKLAAENERLSEKLGTRQDTSATTVDARQVTSHTTT
jgi:flagellar biosynthesis/type III secretory pathway M-ring protein FliF/YscJ